MVLNGSYAVIFSMEHFMGPCCPNYQVVLTAEPKGGFELNYIYTLV